MYINLSSFPHVLTVICDSGSKLSFIQISCKLGTITGNIDINVFQFVRIYTNTYRQRFSINQCLTILKNFLNYLAHLIFFGNCSKMVTTEAADSVLTKVPGKNLGELYDQLIAHIKAVMPVVIFDVDDIDIYHDRFIAFLQNALFLLSCKSKEMTHIRKICHSVIKDLMIKTVDILFYLIPHSIKSYCQSTNLIFALVCQIHIIICICKPF